MGPPYSSAEFYAHFDCKSAPARFILHNCQCWKGPIAEQQQVKKKKRKEEEYSIAVISSQLWCERVNFILSCIGWRFHFVTLRLI